MLGAHRISESIQLTQFKDLGLAEDLLRAVTAEGYTIPTPIQARVIPAMLAKEDILGTAQTGTGKTAAFVLPLLQQMIDQPSSHNRKGCRALILAPTRELAQQIADSIRTYAKYSRATVTVVVGGVRPGPQIKAVAPGIDFIVATPGRLLDHMSAGVIQLSGTSNVVLDEADQMLDLGFVPAIRKILAQVPGKRQTVLLSATMPKQIRKLAHDFLRKPTEVAVAPVARPIEKIDQSVMHVDAMAKRRALVDILKGADVERTIVFTRTKRGADKVTTHLEKNGISASAIHGNKSQGIRERTLAGFRNGRIKVLVATDIAARGIDVDDISHVVNYDLPHVPESYVHRIGRTARAGKSGIAIALCDRTEQPLLRDIERLVGYSLKTIPGPQSEKSKVRLPETRTTPREAQKPNRRRPAQSRRKQQQPAANTQAASAAAPVKAEVVEAAPVARKKRNKRRGANVADAQGTNAQGANVSAPVESDTAGLARVIGKIGVSDTGENYLRR